MPHRRSRRLNRDQKALMFGILMLGIFSLSIMSAISSTGPLVLGTEKNTNGLVEYLCLGRDCETLF
ncbi:MAG TPA: hypothetical protein PLF01_06850 [Alphaproteobacteria bacterium]|nr:hypothetical protein [Alphaproteobacteria bacterium]